MASMDALSESAEMMIKNINELAADEKRVRTHISGANSELFFNYNIDVMFMPVRKSQAIAEGWIPKTWKKPKKKKSEGSD